MLTDEMKAAGWIEHDGGPCPVPLDSRPDVMFKDGQIWLGKSGIIARHWVDASWTGKRGPHQPKKLPRRIIAYKPEAPHE